MKKIRLDPDALNVQSFTIADPGAEHGTVRGAQQLFPPPPRSEAACQVESGMCLGTRYDYTCNTSFCALDYTLAAGCVAC
jgi:hypothetical protein